ncbi:hypothetical protein [Vibrio paucivorans]|uniref:Uncharacterized protein n=1 Tax=Vibrio paucivorans TaxID=2829489 RepID=A0A9X3CBF5_9VIBR|nr:hypothetical protein [Vibrio paucivorans]MCW8332581.1 hypothetical protein [Vibrio paucivorans]
MRHQDNLCHQGNPDLQLWLREAKVLQKAAQSTSLADSLPVLRRLLDARVLTNISLPELKKNASMIQRKHLLNLLAAENGSNCWADFKHQITQAPKGSLRPYSTELREAGYPVLWFSTQPEAKHYADTHGGKVVQVGKQAAVVPNDL